MKPETRNMILSMLETRTPIEVHRALSETTSYAGITYSQVRCVRRYLLEHGAKRLPPSVRSLLTVEERRQREINRKRDSRALRDGRAAKAMYGDPSSFLLRRQLETGQHFISCPDMMAKAMRQAGMVA